MKPFAVVPPPRPKSEKCSVLGCANSPRFFDMDGKQGNHRCADHFDRGPTASSSASATLDKLRAAFCGPPRELWERHRKDETIRSNQLYSRGRSLGLLREPDETIAQYEQRLNACDLHLLAIGRSVEQKIPVEALQTVRDVIPRCDEFTAAFIRSPAFLQTYEWKRTRMVALTRYGARCQCCGATPASGAKMNVDHIKPRSTHPELALDPNNTQVLCDACNHGKANWDSTDWRGNPR